MSFIYIIYIYVYIYVYIYICMYASFVDVCQNLDLMDPYRSKFLFHEYLQQTYILRMTGILLSP